MNQLFTIFHVPELRRKILITILFLCIYRIGYFIPLPVVDQAKMQEQMLQMQGGALGQVLGLVSLFSGGNLSQACIFGLGIMPYISSSIIFQLLASVYPPLEKLQKEGEAGRKKINEYTRYATVRSAWCRRFSTSATPWPNSGYRLAGPDHERLCLLLPGRLRPDHDGRHRVSDVARGTNRRIWDRQRHQPHHHGRHRRPHSGRDQDAVFRRGHASSGTFSRWAVAAAGTWALKS